MTPDRRLEASVLPDRHAELERALLSIPRGQDRPVADPVAILHRHRSFIATAFRRSGRWVRGPGIRADQLVFDWPTVFGGSGSDDFDQYLSLNGFAGVIPIPGRPARRSNSTVVRLCAAAVDLDCHALEQRTGFSIGAAQAAGAALDRARRGEIPEPSLIVESGRGAWLLWLLANEAGEAEVCTHETRLVYRATVRTLADRLLDLGADLKALDEARMLRAPGSRNRKAFLSPDHGDGRVRWLPVIGLRHSPLWSLSELASAAGVEVGTIQRERERFEHQIANSLGVKLDPERRPPDERDRTKQENARFRWSLLAQRIEALGALRGGFEKGHRTRAVTALAVGLSRSNAEPEELLDRCRRLGRACRPPLTAGEIREAVKARNQLTAAGIRNRYWADSLHVTEAEAEALSVNIDSSGKPFPPASMYQPTPPPPAKLSRTQQRAIREDWLRARFPGRVCREPLVPLSVACSEETGLDVSEKTIGADLDRLGIRRARHGRRPSDLPFE